MAERKTKTEGAKTPSPEHKAAAEARLSDPEVAGPRNVPADATINQKSTPSKPETVRSAAFPEPDKAEPDKANGSKEVKNKLSFMVNAAGERMKVTSQQWAKHGQLLQAHGWNAPEFEGDPVGSEPIPGDIAWGRDKVE